MVEGKRIVQRDHKVRCRRFFDFGGGARRHGASGKKKQHGHAIITENPSSLNMDLGLQLAREHTVLMMMHLEVKRTKSY